MERVIRLNERDLHNIINESVKTILQESTDEGWGKNLAMAGMMGLGMLGGMHDAQAQAHTQGIGKSNNTIFTTDYGHGLSKSDTLHWNEYNQLTEYIESRLNTFIQNGKQLCNSEYKEDIVSAIENQDFQEGFDRQGHYGGIVGVMQGTFTKTHLANYIQQLGASNLKGPGTTKIAIIQYKGNTYIYAITPMYQRIYNSLQQ